MSSYLALKTQLYQQNILKVELKTLYVNFVWLLQNLSRLSVSRTVSHLIMGVRKPTVAYKLVLQEKPQERTLTY